MNQTWLTQEAYDRLKAELDQLVNVERSAISKKIQAAREEGDLKENGGYHAAKEEQGIIEARIARLKLNGKKTEFLLGSAEMADNTDLTVYSPDSPLGNAIIDTKIGETVEYLAPNGKTFSVKIIAVKHFTG